MIFDFYQYAHEIESYHKKTIGVWFDISPRLWNQARGLGLGRAPFHPRRGAAGPGPADMHIHSFSTA